MIAGEVSVQCITVGVGGGVSAVDDALASTHHRRGARHCQRICDAVPAVCGQVCMRMLTRCCHDGVPIIKASCVYV